jgi:hypothetical protein
MAAMYSVTLSRKVFRKSIHTEKYLNYNSHHHASQKISVIDSLAYRALRICDEKYVLDELNHIRRVLTLNGYPISKINQRIRIMEERVKQNIKPTKCDNWAAILFVGKITYQIARIIKKFLPLNLGY